MRVSYYLRLAIQCIAFASTVTASLYIDWLIIRGEIEKDTVIRFAFKDLYAMIDKLPQSAAKEDLLQRTAEAEGEAATTTQEILKKTTELKNQWQSTFGFNPGEQQSAQQVQEVKNIEEKFHLIYNQWPVEKQKIINTLNDLTIEALDIAAGRAPENKQEQEKKPSASSPAFEKKKEDLAELVDNYRRHIKRQTGELVDWITRRDDLDSDPMKQLGDRIYNLQNAAKNLQDQITAALDDLKGSKASDEEGFEDAHSWFKAEMKRLDKQLAELQATKEAYK